MQFFYDGQIRRYILQVTRFFSNFYVKYGDGTLVRVPVMYGDSDRQVANIVKQNSENKINSAPRIAVSISGLALERDRLGDSTYVGKLHIRERDIVDDVYTGEQGANYTVERIMPTPYKLSLKVEIWSTSTDQKLQIMEQILVLFNPSVEIQTTDNYIDWTSLSVLNLDDIVFSSRQIPVGVDSPIDIATVNITTPIWLSPPVKVRQLGIITKIITSVLDGGINDPETYIEGLGIDPALNDYGPPGGAVLARVRTTVSGYGIMVYAGAARLLAAHEPVVIDDPYGIPNKIGPGINWRTLLDQYPGKYIAGYSSIRLIQENDHEVFGTFAVNALDETLVSITWDSDTYPTNTMIDSNGDYTSVRSTSHGTFDAIINPQTKGPGAGLPAPVEGQRYLIIERIGSVNNIDGADAWKNDDDSDFVAEENDIIEWSSGAWHIIFAAGENSETAEPIYQTNIYTGIQYKWDGYSWTKSFEGEYREGMWVLEL